MKSARGLLFALIVAALGPALGGCAHGPRPPDAFLRVVRPAHPPPDDAGPRELVRVYVDDQLVGRRDGSTVGLPAGVHRVAVRGEGRITVYREIKLRRGEHLRLPVSLHPDLDQQDDAAPRDPAAGS